MYMRIYTYNNEDAKQRQKPYMDRPLLSDVPDLVGRDNCLNHLSDIWWLQNCYALRLRMFIPDFMALHVEISYLICPGPGPLAPQHHLRHARGPRPRGGAPRREKHAWIFSGLTHSSMCLDTGFETLNIGFLRIGLLWDLTASAAGGGAPHREVRGPDDPELLPEPPLRGLPRGIHSISFGVTIITTTTTTTITIIIIIVIVIVIIICYYYYY